MNPAVAGAAPLGAPGTWRVALLIAVCAYAFAVVRTAWLGDDCYISLRVVENVAGGHGLRWNTAERVLVSTHPLWLLLLSALRPLTGEVYYTTVFTALALALAALALVARAALSLPQVVLAVTTLTMSRAYVEYSTSGLENPLAHLLLAAFIVLLLRSAPRVPLFSLSLLGSLLVCTRYDLALVIAPALGSALWRARRARALAILGAGFTPLLAWLVFATIYFGSPLPMPSHAKLLGTGIAWHDMAAQGLTYLRATLHEDPLTLVALGAGLLAGLLGAGTRSIALGALLYLAYVVRIGGDFMLGRFLTVPLLVAVLCGVRAVRGPRTAATLGALALGLGLLSSRPPLLSRPSDLGQGAVAHGIGDERGAYYGSLGLLSPTRSIPIPGVATALLRAAGKPEPEVFIAAAVGVVGFVAGPGYYLVDTVLCDPLICRLPALETANWRVGHLMRRVPDGYLATVFLGANRLRHASLAAYYDKLVLLTRGELFARGRWRAIRDFARGADNDLLRAYVETDYRTPPPLRVRADELRPTPEQAPWHAPGVVVVPDGGVEVDLGVATHATTLRVSLHSQGSYVLAFVREGRVLGEARAVSNMAMRYGMSAQTVPVPAAASSAGFDEVVVRLDRAATVDQVGALGYIEF
jgi:arabinofuranosyltransferase